MHHNIVMHIQFLRKLIINKREETTNFNIFISTKQHLAHQKGVKSTIDVLTFIIHYKSMVRGFLFQILQKISMILILHSVCSILIDSFTILFSHWWRKLAYSWSFFRQFFYHAWPNHNIGPNQFDIWSNLNDIWTKQIVISDPIRLISSPITQCYLLSFLT